MEDFTTPARPAYGLHSTKVDSWSNCFPLNLKEGQRLFRYDLEIQPDVKNRRRRRQLFNLLLGEVQMLRDLGTSVATDYASIIITPVPLPLGPGNAIIVEQDFREAIGRTPQASAVKYKIKISFTEEIPTEKLLREMKSETATSSDSHARERVTQALNIVVATFPNRESDVYQVGRNRFFRWPKGQQGSPNLDIGGGLVGVRGYSSNVRIPTGRILLNVDPQCSAFYKAINLADLMNQIERQLKIGSVSNEDLPKAMDSYIHGLRIRIEPLKSLLPADKDAIAVPERIMTVQGLAYMREPLLDVDGKQKRDDYGKLRWKGPTAAKPSNARNLRFPNTQMNGPNPISVFDYFDRSKFVSPCNTANPNRPTEYGRRLQRPNAFNVVNCGKSER